MTAPNFNSHDCKRSRRAYILECAFEYFIALMVADAFLATLLTNLGLDDAVIGVISSLISLAFLFQLFSIFVVQHIRNVKLVAIPIHCVSQMFFLVLYLLPFFNIPERLRTVIVVGCLLIAYFGNYLVTSLIFNWGNSYVDPNGRAGFAATKEIVSLLSGVVVSLSMGWAMDRFTEAGNIQGGFLFIALMMAIFAIGDFICLMCMKNQKREKLPREKTEPFLQVVRTLFANKGFRSAIIVHSIWTISVYMTVGFMGTYKTKELLLTVGTVQIINIAGCMIRACFSKPIARYADKRSYAQGIKLGMFIAAVGYLINIFTTPSLWFLVILYTVIYNVSCAGTSQNLINLTYNYVDRQYFVQASAIKFSISGLCGFGASMVGSRILDAVQKNGNSVFGISMYGQQLLSAISLAIVLFGIVFVRFVMEKQKIIAK
jgi:F0F1-type ATP synthase assembly protein I